MTDKIFTLLGALVVTTVFCVSQPNIVMANNTNPAPIASIGSGNGNIPSNTSPNHMGIFHGMIPVFATVLDDNLENYHFRVIKDGGSQGHTCTALGSLFASENQGYASTTLGKDACGFNFNQSVYISPSGFSNTQIATLNTVDLSNFGGEGDYWLIIGALDITGNRTNTNYLDDPKIKITVDNTPPVSSGVIGAGRSNTDPVAISGTTTDTYGITSTTLLFSSYDGTNCGTTNPIISLTGTSTSSLSWSHIWTPTASGLFCIYSYGEDMAGNIEKKVLISSGISYEAPSNTVQTQNGGGGAGNGNSGSSGSGGGGGNGPLATGNYLGSYAVGYINNTQPTGNSHQTNSSVQPLNYNNSNMTGQSILLNNNLINVPTDNTVPLENIADALIEEITENQIASVSESGFSTNWYWIIIAILFTGGMAYYYFKQGA